MNEQEQKPPKQRKKLELKGKHLLAGFLALLLIAGAATWWNLSHKEGADGYSLTIAREGEVVKTFTLQEIKEAPQIEAYANLQSAQHDNAEGTYKGADLRELLNKADPSLLKECRVFICTAGDGYSSALSPEDLARGKDVLVAYQKDGTGLEHFYDGGQGPMRLIVASDTYGNRSIKFLTRIECRK